MKDMRIVNFFLAHTPTSSPVVGNIKLGSLIFVLAQSAPT